MGNLFRKQIEAWSKGSVAKASVVLVEYLSLVPSIHSDDALQTHATQVDNFQFLIWKCPFLVNYQNIHFESWVKIIDLS